MKLNLFRWICIAPFALAAIIFTINLISIYQYSLRDDTRPADCAIVAGAGVSANRPSPIFQQRLNHALWLWKNGYAHHLILTGGFSPGAQYSDADIARRYLIARGVPSNILLYEQTSTVTHENLRNAKVIMDEYHFRTALLVSDPLHMRRIMRMATDEGIHGWSSPTRTSRIRSGSAKIHFILREAFYYTGYMVNRWR